MKHRASLRRELGGLKAEIADARQSADRANTARDNAIEDRMRAEDELQEIRQRLDAEIEREKELKSQTSTVRVGKDALQEEVERLQGRISGFESESSRLREDIDRLNADTSVARNRRQEAAEAASQTAADFHAKRKEVENVNRNLIELTESRERAAAELGNLEGPGGATEDRGA